MTENRDIIHINSSLYIDEAGVKGKGVYTKFDLHPMIVIEISSVLVMSAADRQLLDATPLYNYIFEWGTNNDQCCAAWGYISMYNHSYNSNCEYFMDFDKQTITIKTVKSIQSGEELTINYNGNFNDTTPLWFDAI